MKILLALTLLLTLQQAAVDVPIKIAIIVPVDGPVAETGEAERAALQAYIDEVNKSGGINGRKLELRIAPLDKEPATTAANLKRLATEEKVVAFVGGIIAGHEQEIGSVVQSEAVPLIGAASLDPPEAPNRYVFHLYSGVKDQARALVNFAAGKPELKKAPAVIVYVDNALNRASVDAVEQQAKLLGWPGVTRIVQMDKAFQAAGLVNDLKQRGVQSVFVFATPAMLKGLIDESVTVGFTPTFLAHGHISTPQTYGALSSAFKNKFFLSFPTVPSDVSAISEYRALQANHSLTSSHVASQLQTLAAAKVFVEGLKRAALQPGKPLDVKAAREQVINALENLRDFDTGFSPRITFGQERRIGARGAYLISFDPDAKQLVAVGGFVTAN